MTTATAIPVYVRTTLNGLTSPRSSTDWIQRKRPWRIGDCVRLLQLMGLRSMLVGLFLASLVCTPANAQSLVATVPIGPNPSGVAVNMSTNTVYVSDIDYNTVTVVNGATNTTTTIQTGGTNGLGGLAVNETTNTIYVLKSGLFGNTPSLIVINGATGTISTTISVPSISGQIAVNPVTNQIYVSTWGGPDGPYNVVVIDGTTNAVTATISIPRQLGDIVVDSTRNVIYALNVTEPGNAEISVIDGTTNAITATIPVGYNDGELELNATTNTLYVPDNHGSQLYVIDGATDTVRTTVPLPEVSTVPHTVAVNTATNTVYVAGQVNSAPVVQVLNGATNAVTATISVPVSGGLLANTVTNKVWQISSPVVVIDGASNTTASVTGTSGVSISSGDGVLNTTTNYAYMAGPGNVYVINGAASGPAFSASPSPLAFGNQTEDKTSSPLTLTVTNTGTTDLKITTVTAGGPNMADFPVGSDTCSNATVSAGKTCTVSVEFAPSTAAAESATLTFTDNASGSPQVVNLTGTGVAPVTTPTTTALSASAPTVAGGTSVTFTATVTPTSGTPTPTGTVTFKDGTTTLGTGAVNGSGIATYASSSLSVGSHSITASYGGDTLNTASVSNAVTVTVTVIGTAASPSFNLAAGTYYGTQSVTLADTTPGAMIYYTTDGSTPPSSSTSTLYSDPISVTASETINAIAVAPNYSNSTVVSAAYVISQLPPTYTIAFSPSTLTIADGQSASTTITVTPQNGFKAPVSFACTGQTLGVSCAFSSATVTPSNNQPATATLTISTFGAPGSLARSHAPSPLFPGTTLALALCLFGWRKRRGILQLVLLLAVGVAGLSLLNGCGGSSQTPHSTAVVVQTSSGSIQQNATLTIIVDY